MYNRKVELQAAADAIAIAAAKELDGTDTGIARAVAAAAQVANDSFYDYNNSNVVWSNAAIRFATKPDASTWLDDATAAQPANAANLFYARVDTNLLASQPGDVSMFLLEVFPSVGATSHISSSATAGRASIGALPLAICAMSTIAGAARGTELVEYGFRRGISYNLMQLNPDSDAKGANYLINPVALAGTTGASVINRMDVIRPFVCTGTLAIPNVIGGNITVEPDFPLDSVFQQLNSRFGKYTTPCNSSSAPPDTNVKEFSYLTEFPWLNSPPTSQSAESRKRASPKQLLTVADLPASEILTTNGGVYGPLWIYAPAVIKDTKYVSGQPEPKGGYTKFSATGWPTPYTPGDQKVKPTKSYPSTPYKTNIESPTTGTGVDDRRVLNVPLLRCPVTAGSPTTAEVLAIGKFFMTIQATDKELYAEFAGLAPQTTLGGKVELYR